jgi:hypothetical protein
MTLDALVFTAGARTLTKDGTISDHRNLVHMALKPEELLAAQVLAKNLRPCKNGLQPSLCRRRRTTL